MSIACTAALAATQNGAIICPGHSRPVVDVQFMNCTDDPSSYLLISACLDNQSMLRDGITGDWIGTFIGHKGAVWSSRLNSSATLAATGSADFTAKLWSTETGDLLYTFPHKHIVKTVEFNSDSTKLYTGGHEKLIRVYDLTNYNDTPIITSETYTAPINAIVQLPDSQSIAVCGSAPNVTIHDTNNLHIVKTIQTPQPVTSLTITSDHTTLCISYGKCVSLYSGTSLDHIHTIKLDHSIDCAAYDTTLRRFITGSNEELWVRAYDYDGVEFAVNKGHHGPVRALTYAPHSMTYCSASEDGTIRIWRWMDQKLSSDSATIQTQLAQLRMQSKTSTDYKPSDVRQETLPCVRMLFEDTFLCVNVNENGKKFDRVDRIRAASENYSMSLVLDIASHIYPIDSKQRFQLSLASTLNVDGTPDTNEYIAHRHTASIMDRYDYVMHGKIFKLNVEKDNVLEVLISYGGLLMSLKGDARNLLKLDLDMRCYLLIRKI